MNKKKLNKVISLALMALFANSSCSANINVETGVVSGGRTIKNAMLGNGKMQNSVRPKCSSEELAPSCSGSTLTDSSLVAVSSIILGLTAVGSVGIAKYNEWGPFAPNKPGTPSETPDEGEPAPKVETPKFVDMYQQARFALGQPCLRDYAIEYLNEGVDLYKRLYPGSYYPLYIGFDGDFVAFEDLDTIKKKEYIRKSI